jgi:hypothetical protein
MKKFVRARLLLLAVGTGLVLLATGTAPAMGTSTTTCTGDQSAFPGSAGTIKGTYSGDVVVDGTCAVDAGPAVINGNLILLPGSTLVAAFASDDLTVRGSIQVKDFAALIIGCNPVSFSCVDNADGTATAEVSKNLTAELPLGLVAHNTTVDGKAVIDRGGGGINCISTPFPGIFGVLGSPAYVGIEDSSVHLSLTIQGVFTCWLGVLRVKVGRNLTVANNIWVHPDSGEVVGNFIGGNISCSGNNRDIQFGDSGAAPNQVRGTASGQCGFNVLSPDPFYDGGGPQPISVKR